MASRWARKVVKASLISREMIADSIELVARANYFDGGRAGGLRQDDARHYNVAHPAGFAFADVLYGGSIAPGHYSAVTSR